mmetsp:Transcript_12724/g.34684  ORF Transcript_12724/g.34684 Transcript_12724/m.34684 type:complete len:221 (-) Transcript_12724:1682-2344(-)
MVLRNVFTTLLIFLLHALGSGTVSPIPELLPGQHRKGEVLELDTETKVYRLGGLSPGRSYEIRVSHPAFIPASLNFQLSNTGVEPLQKRSGRRLLDCDKLIFTVASDGSVQGNARPLLLLSASSASIHRDGPGAGIHTLLYNIVVQPLILGIPVDTLPVILVCLALLLGVYLVLPLWTANIAPALLNYITLGTFGLTSNPVSPKSTLQNTRGTQSKQPRD